MTVETRPAMTLAEFEREARYVPDNWWLTGEGLIHVAPVMSIEGWNFYGHPGNDSLTEAQRVLMIWSDVVGQVQNGGFTQFCDNHAPSLAFAARSIAKLGWRELSERFERALREQAGDPIDPHRFRPVGLDEEPEKWARSRERLIRHLARQGKPWWKPTTMRDLAFVEARHEEWQLQLKYQTAVIRGELASGGEQLFDFVPPPEEEANAFDDWFYLAETKQASIEYVSDYILRHRDELCRIEG